MNKMDTPPKNPIKNGREKVRVCVYLSKSVREWLNEESLSAFLSRSCYLNTLIHELMGDYEPYFTERAALREK